jgi:predicted nuclease of predicted toxin-antitoxin system
VTFFLDQDVPDDLAHWLRHRGHLVTCLREVLPTTTTDSDAWQWARTHGAAFVSCNRDDVLALRPEGEHPGIVILVRRRTRQAEIAAMQKLLTGAGKQGLANNINYMKTCMERLRRSRARPLIEPTTDRFLIQRS